jgi:hypothetical protein
MTATVKILLGGEPWTTDGWLERQYAVTGVLVTTAVAATALESRAAPTK